MLKSIFISTVLSLAAIPAWSKTFESEFITVVSDNNDTGFEVGNEYPLSSIDESYQSSSKNIKTEIPSKRYNQLGIYPLFEKYKRNPSCTLTVIENGNNNFYELTSSSKEITEEISRIVNEDLKYARSRVLNYTEHSDEIVASFDSCTLIFNARTNGRSCSLSLSWQTPAE